MGVQHLPKTKEGLKIGSKRHPDGWVFYRYKRNANYPEKYYEVWVSPERFEAIRTINQAASKRQYHKNPDYHGRYTRLWAKRNPARHRELSSVSQRKLIKGLSWSSYLLFSAKTSSCSRGFGKPSIDESYIRTLALKNKHRCYWTGVRLDLVAHGNRSNPKKISLDRIDNTKGYSKDNIVVASWGANRMRGNMDTDSFKTFLASLGIKKWEAWLPDKDQPRLCSRAWASRLFNSVRWRSRRARIKAPSFGPNFIKGLRSKQNGRCGFSGVEMDFTSQRDSHNPRKASVDRKDNSIGYTKKNIHLVCSALNRSRGTSTLNDFLIFIEEAGIRREKSI